jgi:hypothetical protein
MFPEAYPPRPVTATSQTAKIPVKQAVSLLSMRAQQQQITPLAMPTTTTTSTSSGPCTILYDPCTGKVLSPNTLAELEKRVAALKATSVGSVTRLIGGSKRKTRRFRLRG